MAYRQRLQLLAGLITLTAFCPVTLYAQEKGPAIVKFSTFVATGYQWTTFIAEDKGFLAAENMKLDWTEVRSTPDMLRFLSTGAVDIASNVPNMAVTGIQKGVDVTVVSGLVDKVTANLIARPGIQSVKDLKGKVVASSGLTDITAIGIRRTLREHGLSDKDWDLVVVGGTRDRFTALTSGAVDAAVLGQPFDMIAEEKGFNNVAPQSQYLKDFPWLVVIAYQPWAKKNPKLAAGFLRAHKRAHEWLYNQKNRDEAIDILAKRTKTPGNLAGKLYKLYVLDLQAFSRDLAIPKRGMQVTLEVLAEAGEIKPPLSPIEKYIDERYYKLATGH